MIRPATRPLGRRPGASGSREDILGAARASFADRGYDGTTIRGVAKAAGVDPGLVMHYFGNKDGVFEAAMQLPVDAATLVPALIADGVEELGERLLRVLIGIWEDPLTSRPMLAVLRPAVRHERAAALLRGFVGREVLGRLAVAIEAPDPELRATLVGSQLIGLAMARYVLRVEPLASADPETVIAAVAPNLQRYLVGVIQQA